MGRGRKFTKMEMHDDEGDAVAPADDDTEVHMIISDGSGGIVGADLAEQDVGSNSVRADSTERESCNNVQVVPTEGDTRRHHSPEWTAQRDHIGTGQGRLQAAAPDTSSSCASSSSKAMQLKPVSPSVDELDRQGEEAGVAGSAAASSRWQELAAEAAGIEIEAMHWDQAGSPVAAAQCYRQVAVKLHEAAAGVQSNHAVRKLLEQRAAKALERVAALEGMQGAPVSAADERSNGAKLATEGILASSLAASAGLGETEDQANKSFLCSEDAKIFGTAATLGAAAGMVLMGPIAGASLGAMAAYATTREDQAGAAARKVCNTSIGVADHAVNKAVGTGLKGADFALEEGRRRLLEAASSSSTGGESKIQDWCSANKGKVIRAAGVVEALQSALPRHKLCEEARRMRAKYPDRVPVLCERGSRSDLPDIAKNKFAVPASMLCGEFKYIIHKQVAQATHGLAVDQTIYVFVGGASPKTSATMAELYELHAAEDGFLYVCYTAENTLGRRHACT